MSIEPEDCYFYHAVTLPDGSVFPGEWDLRAGVDAYLGHVDFRGRRVIDVGTANGFLSFSIEQRGAAEVVSFDLDPQGEWDLVPYAGHELGREMDVRKRHIARINNAYRFCHAAFGSRARPVHGSVYRLPAEVGAVDIAVLGSILLHLRDPWAALRSVAAVTQQCLVVTELVPHGAWYLKYVPFLDRPRLTFLPDAARNQPLDTWWTFTPSAIVRMCAVLGFNDARVTFHSQPRGAKQVPLYTVVARRGPSRG
jgi:hypothetical protein